MANKKGFFSQFRFVYRHSPLVLKVVLLATIVLSIAALTTLRIGIIQANNEKDAYRAQAAQMEQQNAKLEKSIGQQGTVQGAEDAAMGELGLVYPDTVFFDVEENQD